MSVATAANHLYLLAAAPARARFERAARDPARAQWAILSRILRENAQCEFGARHGFRDLRSVAAFRDRVPLCDYDGVAADIDRITTGAADVLTTDPVRCLEPTGGSSGAAKLIPYTRRLMSDFSAATQAWICDLLWSRPALRQGRAYWAVTPPARRPARAPGGVPIGLEHDSDYFPPIARALLDRVLGLPRAIAKAPDVTTCRYLTLRALLALPDLALVSVWSPSFLALLADALDEHWHDLLADLADGALRVPLAESLRAELARSLDAHPLRALALRRRFARRPPADLGDLWTGLALISCWSDGHAGRALEGMRRRFPRVEVQGKGLLATEGVVSFPLFEAEFPVAAVTSHFLEFIPHRDEGGSEDPVTVDRVVTGETYEVVLTTSGGLYRYRLRDLVRVAGWYRATPLLTFVGRADGASDLAGEKLTPSFVERVLAAAARITEIRPSFAMLAPAWVGGEPPRYHLYVEAEETDAARLARAVEHLLKDSHHYALCRALGQLGPVYGVAVRDGARVHERVRVSRGQRAGAVKPVALDAALDWARAFSVDAAVTTDNALVSS